MSANQVALWYLVASVLFILALKGLSHPETARRGNWFGIVGMLIAVATTLAITRRIELILVAILIGGTIGAVVARRVQMTQMPELVAAMHSLVGMAAVLIAIAIVHNPPRLRPARSDPDAATSSSSSSARSSARSRSPASSSRSASSPASASSFRLFSSAPVVFKGQHLLNLALAIVMIGFGVAFFLGAREGQWPPFLLMTAIAFVLGVLIIIPIGGADMPVVISMLNSYSGWAAAGIGFSLNNSMLIVAGSLVGSSGAILSYIMCKAMNRSFFSVILGGFGAAEGTVAAGGEQKQVRSRLGRRRRLPARQRRERDHRPRLRPGGGARPARGEGDGGEAARTRA